MKIVISDHENVLQKDLSVTVQKIKEILPESEIEVVPFSADKKNFYEGIQKAEGLITAFLPVDTELFRRAPKLRCVSINAVGYSNVDVEEAKKHGITVCHVGEYCTQEVAEHTIALMCALNRNLKHYGYQVEKEGKWQYASIPGGKPLADQTVAVFGFGNIGKRVAKLAKGLGMQVIVVSQYLAEEEEKQYGVRKVTVQEAFEIADIITNHRSLTKETYHFFDETAFGQMKKSPLFINVGRGGSVEETALVKALDTGLIRGAGLDVLEEEDPDMKTHPLLHRDNVILTPHSAFYSEESLKRLQMISGENIAYVLKGENWKVQENIV